MRKFFNSILFILASYLEIFLISLSVIVVVCVIMLSKFSTATPGRVVSAKWQVDKRLEQTINRDWTFYYFSSPTEKLECADPDYDDSDWPAIALPHTWSTYETTQEIHPFIKCPAERDSKYWWHGWGWYRKRFVVDSRHKHNKIFAEFDGVQKYSKVFVNGKFVGDHKGGYTSFSFDITDYVKYGKKNVLTVEVNNQRDDPFGGIAPMSAGNFNVYGGVYRDVRIVIKDRLYIPFQGSYKHEGGTHITTPKVSASAAKVRVRTYVKNEQGGSINCTLTTIIKDPDGAVVEKMVKKQAISSGTIATFDQTGKTVANPKLWSPDTPKVYTVESIVSDGTRQTDLYTSTFGFRWFKWDYKEKMLYLNDKRTVLEGINRHQEYPWLGDAIPKWLSHKENRQIRYDLNMNFMRTSHYPQDPIVYDLSDRIGFVIMEEVPNIKSKPFGKTVQKQNVREMVRRDRNHPSIIFWCVGNETDRPSDPAWVKAEDPTRIVAARSVKRVKVDIKADDDIQIEDFCRCSVRGWYNKDVKDSEQEENQWASHDEWAHTMFMKEGFIRHGSYWLFADHGCDREYWYAPLKHVNPKGFVDLWRVPKYFYYLYQANRTTTPMVFIHPHFWRSRYLGQKKSFIVDSNCDSIELKVNGVSKGIKHPSKSNLHVVTFDNIKVKKGVIEAIGRKGNQIVISKVVLAGKPARVVLTVSHDTITADRAGVSIITADIVDDKGIHIYGANPDITWKVIGQGKLVGPRVYSTDIDKNNVVDGIWYMDVPINNIVRSTRTPGTITVRAEVSGCVPGVITIKTVTPKARPDIGIDEPALSDIGRKRVPKNPDEPFTLGDHRKKKKK